jgi:hypothetical protein
VDTTRTVKQNLEEMLELATRLRRPSSEVEAIRRQLSAYGPRAAEQARAAQDEFLERLRK